MNLLFFPGQAALDLDFEGKAQECSKTHDGGQHAHIPECRIHGHGGDDVRRHKKFETQENALTEPLTVFLISFRKNFPLFQLNQE